MRGSMVPLNRYGSPQKARAERDHGCHRLRSLVSVNEEPKREEALRERINLRSSTHSFASMALQGCA
jgi:hypothetical protein